MRLPVVIGIIGKAGSGKDTLANAFINHGAIRYSFAQPLKRALCEMFNWPLSKLEDREWQEQDLPAFGRSPRFLMQTLGTEWGREVVHSDFWVLLADHFTIHQTQPVVIPDVRFPNEAKWVKSMGGALLRVVRPDLKAIKESAHASETMMDSIVHDFSIINDGTIHDLHVKGFGAIEEGYRLGLYR